MSHPKPFSREEPCITCGAGMSHSPDAHESWCAWQAELNVSINRTGTYPLWYLRNMNRLTPRSRWNPSVETGESVDPALAIRVTQRLG